MEGNVGPRPAVIRRRVTALIVQRCSKRMTLLTSFRRWRWQRLPLVDLLLLLLLRSAHALSSSATARRQQQQRHSSNRPPPPLRDVADNLSGDWSNAKYALRYPTCCVVSVPGLETHLATLQENFCGPDAHGDLDLRMRVRCGGDNDGGDGGTLAWEDCERIRRAVMTINDNSVDDVENDPCTAALVELAHGVSTLADGPLEDKCTDVFMRVVCASSYQARDPMFHTDKCPLRGYVTLQGVGTEFMERICSPLEYGLLRTLGVEGLDESNDNKRVGSSLRRAKELEFIVMKGDYYEAPLPPDIPSLSVATSMLSKVWQRTSACVHRSPPASSAATETASGGRRRVIISLDLADGDDDREWYQVGKKREWRSGMTQRKSRLVA